MAIRRVAGLLVVAAGFLFAQLTSLEGDVKGTDGKAVVGATVKLIRLDVNRTYQIKTDKKGQYFYGSLPAGFYTVAIQVDGRDVAAVTGIKTQGGDPISISFNLSDTPEEHARKAVEAIRRVKGEWSYVKAVPTAGATAVPPAVQAPKAVAVTALEPQFVDPGDSLDSLAKAVETKPENADLHYRYALVLGKAKQYTDMRAQFQKAAQLDPSIAYRAYYNEGILLVNAGQQEDALQSFKRAIDAAPDEPLNAESYYQFGVGLIAKTQIGAGGKVIPAEGTVEALQNYLRLTPEGRNAQAAKGLLDTLRRDMLR